MSRPCRHLEIRASTLALPFELQSGFIEQIVIALRPHRRPGDGDFARAIRTALLIADAE
jgi:hypothetical protein